MRVLLVVDSLKGGGAEAEVLALASTLVAREHVAAIAFFNDGVLRPRFENVGIPLHQVSSAGWRDVRALPRLVSLMRRFRPDVVHTQLTKSDAFGLMAASLAGVRARVVTMQNTNPWREHPLGSLTSTAILRSARAVIAVSPAVRAHLRRYSGVADEKIEVIPNSVDLERFSNGRPAEAPSDRQRRIVGIVGRLVPEKGHADLLRALAILRDRLPHIELMIIGDGPLRADLERQVTELKLASAVRFTGFVADVAPVLRRIDVLAMPSYFEGLPLALLEGMASGLPIVATRVGGIPDAVTDGEHGLLVAPGDVGALAKALGDVLSADGRAAVLGHNARARVMRDFDRRAAHARVLQLYERVVGA